MRIHGNDGGKIGDREKVVGAASAPSGSEAASRTQQIARSGAVVVSQAASELAAQASRGKAAQTERVARVKAAVKDGSYKPDLDRLAEKFVDEELLPPRGSGG